MVVATILFVSTILLISPFVSVYTKGVMDADYVRPLFGFLLVLGEYISAVRMPYNSIVHAAGHFKETKRGAWLEAIINITLSIALVFNFGLVGVAIGTTVAMFIRTVEFVYHANKYVLHRSVKNSVGKIFVAIMITTISSIVWFSIIHISLPTNYLEWILEAVMVFLTISSITILSYCIFYRKEMKDALVFLRKMLGRKGENR